MGRWHRGGGGAAGAVAASRLAAPLLAALLLAGCGGGGSGTGAGSSAIHVEPPRASAAVTKLCAALGRKLPSTLYGRARRVVRPDSPLTAAWGDPPITLRCGVPRPTDLDPTAQLTVVNEVAWFAHPAGSAVPSRFTEVGRDAYVELTVPNRDEPAGPFLVAVSDVISSVVPAKPGGAI